MHKLYCSEHPNHILTYYQTIELERIPDSLFRNYAFAPGTSKAEEEANAFVNSPDDINQTIWLLSYLRETLRQQASAVTRTIDRLEKAGYIR